MNAWADACAATPVPRARSGKLSRRAAAVKTTAAVRGTPAEVDGLSNGGAGQKGRSECLYIISLLRRPLIFLSNAGHQALLEAVACMPWLCVLEILLSESSELLFHTVGTLARIELFPF